MKIGEILRGIADAIDAAENNSQSMSRPGALSPRIAPAAPAPAMPQTSGGELAQQPDDIFVPPLQLKLELLKKATGVENIYDDDSDDEGAQHSYPDPLQQLKRNAGINTVALSGLGDDEPLDD